MVLIGLWVNLHVVIVGVLLQVQDNYE